jgi:hypothetical protein
MRRVALPAAVLLFAAHVTCAAAQTTRLETAYSIYLTGIPVARGSVTIDLSEAGYVASGSARTSRLIRLISKGDGSMNVRGKFEANRMVTSTFSGRYNSSRREQKVEISVANGVAKQISIEPPLPDHDKGRVPLTNESRTNVVDPMSAMLALVAKGDLLAPESCNRTIPIFDGRYRFNVVLSFARTEKSMRSEGYHGPALVCRARYVPIAGHRDRETVQQMADNREMFVWLAPIAGTRVLAPIKASVASPIGTFVVEATRFSVSAQR